MRYPFGTLLKGNCFRVGLGEPALMSVLKRKPWSWRPMSQTTALSNARSASVELSRARVEREEVDLFIAELDEARRLRRISNGP